MSRLRNSLDSGDLLLQPDDVASVEVTLAAQDLAGLSCQLVIASDDPQAGTIAIPLWANQGLASLNTPPQLALISPATEQADHAGPLEIELQVSDVDQSADTLLCQVRSEIHAAGARIADCTPEDASGHMVLELDTEAFLQQGTDTLSLQVEDAAGARATASITVISSAGYPDSDDDGDGWGDSEDADEHGNFDCDDTDPSVYPAAAEAPDGADNDCDGTADEGTENADDDGDGYAEVQGDRDDDDAQTHPGASEQADLEDDDCDGAVGEGTGNVDDDGDGYTEIQGDCDDDDPDLGPTCRRSATAATTTATACPTTTARRWTLRPTWWGRCGWSAPAASPANSSPSRCWSPIPRARPSATSGPRTRG